MSGYNVIWKRLRFFYKAINPIFRVLGYLYSVLAVVAFFQQQGLPAPYDQYRIWDVLPHLYWYWWLVIGLGIFIISALEALYQYDESAGTKVQRILDHKGQLLAPEVRRGSTAKYGVPLLVIIGLVVLARVLNTKPHLIRDAEPLLLPPTKGYQGSSGPFQMLTIGCLHIIPLHNFDMDNTFPFLSFKNPSGITPAITLWFDQSSRRLFADVSLRTPKTGDAFQLRRGHYVLSAPDWDVNSDDNVLEVVDNNRIPALQIIRHSNVWLEIQGYFRYSDKVTFVSPKYGLGTIRGGALVDFPPFLVPLFKYPSWQYPGRKSGEENQACPPATKGSMAGTRGIVIP